MAYDPNRVHSDVASCLDEIARARKGEEVRGSIYDAIELIDTRSVQLETDIRSQAEEITNDALNVHYPLFEIDSDTWEGTCSISGSKMQHLIQYKEAIEPILKVGNNAILHSSTTTANIGTNGPIVKCYYVAPNASNLICYEIHMEYGASKNVTCTRTLTPISGGGSSYTEGDGIDITNNEISVNLRRTLGINSSMLDVDNLGGLYVDIDKLVIGLKMNDTFQKKLTSANAGTGISITNDGQGNPVISSTGGGGGSYTAGEGIDIDSNNAISLKITDEAEGGSVVSFSNAGENLPLKSCIVAIEPVQSGSGDPSPSNVRPISGWTECNITVADDETTPTISNVYNIEFTSEAGTVYGGTLDVTNGVLIVNRVMIDLGDLNWDKISGQNKFYVSDFNNAVKFHILGGPERNVPENFVCSAYKVIGGQDAYDCIYDLTIGGSFFNSTNFLLVNDSNYSTAEDFKAGVQGVKLVYEVATPTTYNLTPTEIKTLLGINNIFADCGDIETPVTYYTEAGEDILYLALHGIPAAEGSEF